MGIRLLHTDINILLSCFISGMDFDFKVLGSIKPHSKTPELLEEMSELAINDIGPLSLIRGYVTCGKLEFLSYQLFYSDNPIGEHLSSTIKSQDSSEMRSKESESTFCKLFFYICVLCEGDITIHYHAFQLMLLWFSRLNKLISATENSLVNNFTSIYESSLHLLLLNIDSPVEDVPDTLVEMFGYLLEIWDKYREQGNVPQLVLQKIMCMPWYVKGKYRLLPALLKYMDTNKVISWHHFQYLYVLNKVLIRRKKQSIFVTCLHIISALFQVV